MTIRAIRIVFRRSVQNYEKRGAPKRQEIF